MLQSIRLVSVTGALLATVLVGAPMAGQVELGRGAEDETTHTASLKELPAESRERAFTLGYEAGDTVTFRTSPEGDIIVLPKPDLVRGFEGAKTRCFEVIIDQLAGPSVREQPELTVSVGMERGIEYFTVKLRLDELQRKPGRRARELGYTDGEIVPIRIDAKTWQWEVEEKEEETFPADVEEIIPATAEHGLIMRYIARFRDLPLILQERALEHGYDDGHIVRLETSDFRGYEIRPPPEGGPVTYESMPEFLYGLPLQFDRLHRAQQRQARELGYRSGEIVWSGPTDAGFGMISRQKAGDGPEIRIVGGKQSHDHQGDLLQLVWWGITEFHRLTPEARLQALDLGYGGNDEVGFRVELPDGSVDMIRPEEIVRNLE